MPATSQHAGRRCPERSPIGDRAPSRARKGAVYLPSARHSAAGRGVERWRTSVSHAPPRSGDLLGSTHARAGMLPSGKRLSGRRSPVLPISTETSDTRSPTARGAFRARLPPISIAFSRRRYGRSSEDEVESGASAEAASAFNSCDRPRGPNLWRQEQSSNRERHSPRSTSPGRAGGVAAHGQCTEACARPAQAAPLGLAEPSSSGGSK